MLKNWRTSLIYCLVALVPALIGLGIGYYMLTEPRQKGLYLDHSTTLMIWFGASGLALAIARSWREGSAGKNAPGLAKTALVVLCGGVLWGMFFPVVLLIGVTILGIGLILWHHWLVSAIVILALIGLVKSKGRTTHSESSTATQHH